MKLLIEPPTSTESSNLVFDEEKRKLTFVPTALKGQHLIKAGYVTARGDGGMESKAVVIFNANTGDFSLQRVDEQVVAPLRFDLPSAEFVSKRKAISDRAKRASDAAAGAKEVEEEEETDAASDEVVHRESVVSPDITQQLPGDPQV